MLEIHLAELEDSECLWRPSSRGLHVVNNSGIWEADWPDSEAYDIGKGIGWTIAGNRSITMRIV